MTGVMVDAIIDVAGIAISDAGGFPHNQLARTAAVPKVKGRSCGLPPAIPWRAPANQELDLAVSLGCDPGQRIDGKTGE